MFARECVLSLWFGAHDSKLFVNVVVVVVCVVDFGNNLIAVLKCSLFAFVTFERRVGKSY